MFEAGIELKKQYGEDNVYDFSLGNPDLTPPKAVLDAIAELPQKLNHPASLGYMPNAGFPDARKALGKWLSIQQKTTIPADNLIMTVGAAGAINALFRAILNPGDEVLCPAPYFVEYTFYCNNNNAKLVPIKSKRFTFELDIPKLEAAINEHTHAIIINSPNNPAGVIYTEEELRQLADVLRKAMKKYGHPIFLVSDEPYRFLTFDGAEVPPIFPLYEYSIIVSSFSKNLSLAGERVGYAAVNPAMENHEELIRGIIFTNRILGFVNAPCIGQRIMEQCLNIVPETKIYIERRKIMAEILTEAGLHFTMPAGTFYFFPEAPNGMDDVKFVRNLYDEHILAVPGSGFGYPGFFRLALCVDKKIILRSREAFIRAVKAAQ